MSNGQTQTPRPTWRTLLIVGGLIVAVGGGVLGAWWKIESEAEAAVQRHRKEDLRHSHPRADESLQELLVRTRRIERAVIKLSAQKGKK